MKNSPLYPSDTLLTPLKSKSRDIYDNALASLEFEENELILYWGSSHDNAANIKLLCSRLSAKRKKEFCGAVGYLLVETDLNPGVVLHGKSCDQIIELYQHLQAKSAKVTK